MAALRSFLLLVAMLPFQAHATKAKSEFSANPVHRVVAMLQMMSQKVEAEGEKTQELFDKFMCYCKESGAKLTGGIQDADEKMPQLASDIKGSTELKAQLEGDLVKHKADREESEAAIAKATEIRNKEAKAFAQESGEAKANIAAFGKAIAAISKGMGAAFLQTGNAIRLRTIFSSDADLSPADRDLISGFLQGAQGYEPASGEILGIMKQQTSTMEKELVEMTQEEEGAVADFQSLVSAQQKSIAQATKAIESKTARVGDVAVEIVNLEDDLEDTTATRAQDAKLLEALTHECEKKKKDHEAVAKQRAQELLAIAETIKILNDDDAAALLQKALPGTDSFLQIDESASEVKAQALEALRSTVRRQGAGTDHGDYRLNFLELAMKGKKVGFEKVIAMVDEIISVLKTEQEDDDKKKAYCEQEIDVAEDEIKVLKGKVGDLATAISENKDANAAIVDELKTLADNIVKLDRDVAEATSQRKEEHAEFQSEFQSNSKAMELIELAKNRMAKFYNPAVYKAPPLTTPPPALFQTETFQSYSKASEEAGGVMAMMDMIKNDLDKEIQEAKFEEKDSQEEYEVMVKAAQKKRATDSKAIQTKEAAKAGMEEELLDLQKEQKSRNDESLEAQQYLAELHKDCDFMAQNYDTRKEARANEIEALGKAKAVLNGADYSLVQTSVRHHLRKRRA